MSQNSSSLASQIDQQLSSHKKVEWFRWKKILVAAVVFVLLLLMGSFFVAYSFAEQYLQKFESTAKKPASAVYQQIQQGLKSSVFSQQNTFTMLLLGTDQVANRMGDPVLTDTMMILNLNLESGQLSAISYPRDLWNAEYKTKINALYQYGFERYPNRPEQFPKQVIEQISGVEMDRTMVLRLDQVSELIDILGGVEINVPEAFVDEQFPRDDVDIRFETDPTKLYEKIEFVKGPQKMSGERSLKYIRSRKSANLDEGTDDARAKRQQQVISALIKKISQPTLVKQPELIGKLYHFYDLNFSQQISLIELIEIANRLRTKLQHIAFDPSSLSIQTEEEDGVITHPPVAKYGQWVYEIVDEEKFQTEVREKLHVVNQ